ncbi:MAG: ATP cone domain-containing protein, partial [Edaphobacter sp.]
MATSVVPPTSITPELLAGAGSPPSDLAPNPSSLQVIRRSGSYSPFDASKISIAITKAFVAVEGSEATASRRIHEVVEGMTQQIVDALTRHMGQS